MFERLKSAVDSLTKAKPSRAFRESYRKLQQQYPSGEDPWGLDLKLVKQVFRKLWPLYRNYFKVRVFGGENIPKDGAFIAIANHSGQVAIDGALIGMAFFADVPHPRVLRAMVERFVYRTPFVGAWIASIGGVLGDRRNCMQLLANGEAVLVFPEGMRGITKNSEDYYEMTPFTSGFFRMALEAQCDILPMVVIGAEEFYPFVHHLDGIASKLGLPALPISANYLPLPSPVDIHIGPIYKVPRDLDADAPDEVVHEHVTRMRRSMEQMIEAGRKQRRPFMFNKPLDSQQEGS